MAVIANVLSPGWTASAARTVVLSAPSSATFRGISNASSLLVWPSMASADCLDFSLDVAAWLAETGDRLAGLRVTYPTPVTPTDLQVLWCTILSGQPVLFLSGGQPNTSFTIRILLITTAGRRHAEQVQIPISGDSLATVPALAPQLALPAGGTRPIPPNALVLPGGAILTDGTGQPFLLA